MATADAKWEGTLTEGAGVMRLGNGGYEGPYSFQSRFEDGEGTNPEELIAAAHAGCFSMALSGNLTKAGFTPESIETSATVSLRKYEGGFEIHKIRLVTTARVPGIEDDAFQEAAAGAKAGCPVSRALAAVETIELEATLEG
jgi:osmotically inducible protein OsmC